MVRNVAQYRGHSLSRISEVAVQNKSTLREKSFFRTVKKDETAVAKILKSRKMRSDQIICYHFHFNSMIRKGPQMKLANQN